jgi:hypothetical protein
MIIEGAQNFFGRSEEEEDEFIENMKDVLPEVDDEDDNTFIDNLLDRHDIDHDDEIDSKEE